MVEVLSAVIRLLISSGFKLGGIYLLPRFRIAYLQECSIHERRNRNEIVHKFERL